VIFCKNNEYSCSFFFPEHEYVLRTPLRSTYVDTIFVSYSLLSQLIETNIRIRKKKTNTKRILSLTERLQRMCRSKITVGRRTKGQRYVLLQFFFNNSSKRSSRPVSVPYVEPLWERKLVQSAHLGCN